MMNDYQILGIAENADPKEIKRAYFRLVRQYSPETDPERFQEIREAYEHPNRSPQSGKKTHCPTRFFPIAMNCANGFSACFIWATIHRQQKSQKKPLIF